MKQKFFVYGTLKKGHRNSFILDNDEVTYLGECVTSPAFTMLSVHGMFPAVMCGGTTPILGEVYETDNPKVINKLYTLEGYSGKPCKDGGRNHYDLEKIDTPFGEANMFVYRDNHNLPVIKSGKW